MEFAEAFDKLPHTEEKAKITGQYVRDEISLFEFFVLATAYTKMN